MFAQRSQNRPRLGINRRKIIELPSKVNRAICLKRQAQIHLLASHPFQLRKEVRHRLSVLPHMTASALATPHALPSVETAVAEAMTSRSRQDGCIQERPVQKPVRQRRIV